MALLSHLNTIAANFWDSVDPKDLLYDPFDTTALFRKKAKIITGKGGQGLTVPIETTATTGTGLGMFDGGNQAITYAADSPLQGMTFSWKYGAEATFMTDANQVQNLTPGKIIDDAKIKMRACAKKIAKLLNDQILAGVHGTATDLIGLVDIFNLAYTTYGEGWDLSNAAKGPYVVALGDVLSSLTLDDINTAIRMTKTSTDMVTDMLAGQNFAAQLHSLVLPSQNFNQGGGMWQIGPDDIKWGTKISLTTDKALNSTKAMYGMQMDNFHLYFAWSGDGFKKSGWYDMSGTVGTLAYVMKVAMILACVDPNQNFKLTWT